MAPSTGRRRSEMAVETSGHGSTRCLDGPESTGPPVWHSAISRCTGGPAHSPRSSGAPPLLTPGHHCTITPSTGRPCSGSAGEHRDRFLPVLAAAIRRRGTRHRRDDGRGELAVEASGHGSTRCLDGPTSLWTTSGSGPATPRLTSRGWRSVPRCRRRRSRSRRRSRRRHDRCSPERRSRSRCRPPRTPRPGR